MFGLVNESHQLSELHARGVFHESLVDQCVGELEGSEFHLVHVFDHVS